MNRVEYSTKLGAIEERYRKAVEEAAMVQEHELAELDEEFVKSNDPVADGDVIRDAHNTIKVDKRKVITNEVLYHLPMMAYTGYVASPQSDGRVVTYPFRKTVIQCNVRSINGKQYRYGYYM